MVGLNIGSQSTPFSSLATFSATCSLLSRLPSLHVIELLDVHAAALLILFFSVGVLHRLYMLQ